ncbi:MAG: ankyrin repeat domain-containing protein [Parvibaculaceae bacterium]
MLIGEFQAALADLDPLEIAYHTAQQVNRYIALQLTHLGDAEERLGALFDQVEFDTGMVRRTKGQPPARRGRAGRKNLIAAAGTESDPSRPNTSRRDNWTGRRGSPDFAIAVYYWFSFFSQDRSYADAIDAALGIKPAATSSEPASVQPRLWLPRASAGSLGDWLNPLLGEALPFCGRREELARLAAFIDNPAPFLLWAIAGASGAGKTRLAIEWMRRLALDPARSNWNIGFFNADAKADFEARDGNWAVWQPSAPTIIVIDYIHEFSADIIAIFRRLSASAKPTHPVRLLILDHIVPESFDELARDARLSGLSSLGVDLAQKRSFYYLGQTLTLGPETHSGILLGEIMASAALHFGAKLDPGCVAEGIAMLRRRQGAWCPLFAALLGRALAIGDSGQIAGRRDLVALYLDTTNRLPWRSANEDLAREGKAAGCLVAATSALGGATLAALMPPLALGGSSLLVQQRVIRLAANIVSSSTARGLPPFLPDILGETFFLIFLAETEHEPHNRAALAAQLTTCLDKRGSGAMLRFFSGMVRNLSEEAQDDPGTLQHWDTLLDYLVVAEHPKALRAQFALVLARIDELLGSGSQPDDRLQAIQLRIRQGLDLDHLIDAAGGANAARVALTFARLYERAARAGKPGPAYEDTLHAIMSAARRVEPALDPIILAAEEGHDHVIAALLASGHWQASSRDRMGLTPLIAASQAGHTAIVRALLRAGVDVNECRQDGASPLILACQQGHEDVVALLLAQPGIDPNRPAETGVTPLFVAVKKGVPAIVGKLLAHPAIAPNTVTGGDNTPLMYAIASSRADLVASLLTHKEISLRGRNDAGMTPMGLAAVRGDRAVVDVLCAHPALDVLEKNDEGQSALHLACLFDHAAIIAPLLARDERLLEARDNRGATPLMYAAGGTGGTCVEALLALGADIGARDEAGAGAIDHARASANEAALSLLAARAL